MESEQTLFVDHLACSWFHDLKPQSFLGGLPSKVAKSCSSRFVHTSQPLKVSSSPGHTGEMIQQLSTRYGFIQKSLPQPSSRIVVIYLHVNHLQVGYIYIYKLIRPNSHPCSVSLSPLLEYLALDIRPTVHIHEVSRHRAGEHQEGPGLFPARRAGLPAGSWGQRGADWGFSAGEAMEHREVWGETKEHHMKIWNIWRTYGKNHGKYWRIIWTYGEKPWNIWGYITWLTGKSYERREVYSVLRKSWENKKKSLD